MGSDFFEGFGKDFESEFRLFSVDGMELGVYLSDSNFIMLTSTAQEVSVLNVEVIVGKAEGEESDYKEDF